MLRSQKELLSDTWTAIRDLPLKYKIGILIFIVFLILFGIVIREFVLTSKSTQVVAFELTIPAAILVPKVKFDDVVEDCGTVMSAKSRKALLYWHNKYRSITAKGEYKIDKENSKLVVLPPATRMQQLVSASLQFYLEVN
ncbi:hypothetical protein Y032_0018g3669 [Ancylostoma ceylanicum]|uniref:Uncharacterized protein n=1 Tax=Ancylostoma ceylanicum TaxID=53326 RepID=A0A016V5N1_9BILA|nr:hypothetical protein Y032_0018g3669 [Ancylostoma ceylanicum]